MLPDFLFTQLHAWLCTFRLLNTALTSLSFSLFLPQTSLFLSRNFLFHARRVSLMSLSLPALSIPDIKCAVFRSIRATGNPGEVPIYADVCDWRSLARLPGGATEQPTPSYPRLLLATKALNPIHRLVCIYSRT